MTDIEIAQKNVMVPVKEVAAKIGIAEDKLELYGPYKAKITFEELKALQKKACQKPGKLILVTAITPTPAGEGKSTVSIGLADGLNKIGKKTVVALREPSLGPCFGVKGGACGGGYAQIVPMEDINLHFTGDIHAISIANNLIATLIDNHIQQGNQLGIDPRTISWKRCMDLNDRSLRNIIVGLGGRLQGVPREDHFTIAVASEIMAIICLSKTISELKERIDRIVIGQNYARENVTFGQLKCTGAVAALLKDVIKPNLVQTLEKNPAFVHGGPFANIAHGCNSVNATMCALATGDYVVTEAGFAADLGAEKFLDIKCRSAGLKPDAVVIVATIRALKMHGGVAKTDLAAPNTAALEKGFENLKTHIENIAKFGLPSVVAVNKFITDSDEEIKLLQSLCEKIGAKAVLSEGWEKGGNGTAELAKVVAEIADSGKADFHHLYVDELPLTQKIEKIAKEIYRAERVDFDSAALKKLKAFEEQGYGKLPVCIAKTQNSISHDPSLIGAPKGFVFPVRDVQLYAGAGFVVALAGDIMTMPGLPKAPAALNIDVDDDGVITGLF
ncbi:Formyltetrahydrofolate synthetase [Treponema sp. JC4]|uniref:formate--tetrahydrofolate ligase n=1 Tax=Treponema sp. JC4 TaxID=1124982 RepID=UPI00025B0C0E|nr:formate--tetrahydrofolate ligase [Treponema sp. JC4]EID85591.1 Formyltetrahydrofolate synthetase [Treponema sp. JC4]